jgi:hypothetical protein
MPHRRWAAAGWVSSSEPEILGAGRVSFDTTGTLCQRSFYLAIWWRRVSVKEAFLAGQSGRLPAI